MDKQYPAGLPDSCYSIGPRTGAPVQIYKGDSTLYGVHVRESVDALNARQGVDRRTEAAMMGGATKGWDSPYADPAHYDDEGCYIGIREGDIDG